MNHEVEIREVGKAPGYENYQNEYLWGGKVIGSSSYDKNQHLHVGEIYGVLKNFYGKSAEGVAIKIQKWLLTHYPS